MLKVKSFKQWAKLVEKGYRTEVIKPKFKPYVYIKTFRTRPSQIFPVAFLGIGAFTHIYVPEELGSKSLWEQIEAIKEIILDHYAERGGGIPLFGKISGYIYCYKEDGKIEFNLDGDIIDYDVKNHQERKAILLMGGKKIENGLSKFKPEK